MNESGADDAKYSREVASGKKLAGAIKSLVNGRCLHLDCARILHEVLLVAVLIYDSEAMIWRENEKERSRIKIVQMENLRDLMGIRSMDKVQKAKIGSCVE